MIDRATVEKAIAPLADGFDADGVKMEVGAISGASVTIRLLIAPGACRECMMPLPYLEQLFQQCLQGEGIEASQVQVVVVDEPDDAASSPEPNRLPEDER